MTHLEPVFSAAQGRVGSLSMRRDYVLARPGNRIMWYGQDGGVRYGRERRRQ
jgi:hypothetical protein